tara:strand:- start:20 stop:346 length:327 start_codon:yes stop_codon:yes gene_type:complete
MSQEFVQSRVEKLKIMEQQEIYAIREDLTNRLKEGKLVVKFNKLNGDYREMTCTLQEGIVPPPKKKDPLSQKKIRDINLEVLSVWDTKAQGWRGFRIDRIIEVEDAKD